MNTKIIYTLKLMAQLVELGHKPIATMPNPKHPELNCWVFKDTEQFEQDFSMLMGGYRNGKNKS